MEQHLDTRFLQPGPLAKACAVAVVATGIGAGVLLACWGAALLWQPQPTAIQVSARNDAAPTGNRSISEMPAQEFKLPEAAKTAAAVAPVVRDGKPSSPQIIQREVTVFSTVEHGAGRVVTGWQYANGAGAVPSRQFCYYTTYNSDRSSTRVDLAVNGAALRNIQEAAVTELPNAIDKCQWWRA